LKETLNGQIYHASLVIALVVANVINDDTKAVVMAIYASYL